ncbi:CGNR zinc finger domain-containing protein [Streptomyces sp. NPDC051561]|uniref:CGNR zinc finger domain-containing protein n=1 Tax=Streptomyces sp. NPDC051561 TaxID=3365658 RepID=UPI0037A79190
MNSSMRTPGKAAKGVKGMPMRSRTGVAYRFDPGALCLELLTTGGPGPYQRYEVLHEPADLAAWADRSRLAPSPAPVLEITESEVADARRVRDALFRIVMALTDDTALTGDKAGQSGPADVATLNEAAARPPLAPAIGPDGTRHWARPANGTQLLATVARDAVELLTGEFAHRVRGCAADNCRLVYVDTSRPGSRRWCSMEHCGNLHKVRALRARTADGL